MTQDYATIEHNEQMAQGPLKELSMDAMMQDYANLKAGFESLFEAEGKSGQQR